VYLPNSIQQRLIKKLHQLNQLRPFPAALVKKLQEQFQLEMTYNSNAIEGNSLTLRETFLVINEGITVKGKPLPWILVCFFYKFFKPKRKFVWLCGNFFF